MTKYETLLFLHIVSVVLLVGGAAVSSVCGILYPRTNDTKVIATLAGLSGRMEYTLTVPGAIGAIVFGTWLAEEGNYMGDAWLTISYILFFISLAIGSGVLGRFDNRIAKRARELQGQGVATSDELQAEAANPLMGVLGMALMVMIFVFIFLMTVKPGS